MAAKQPPYPDATLSDVFKWPRDARILHQDPLVPIGIPEATRFRRGDYQLLAVPMSLTGEEVEQLGLRPESGIYDYHDQYQSPADASERVRVLEAQRCIDVDPLLIVPAGRAFELVRFDIPAGSVGVLERVPTILEVTALEANGDPAFSYSIEQTNGRQPCLRGLAHPDPEVGSLTWTWVVTATHVAWSQGVGDYLAGIPAHHIEGRPLFEPWPDLRYGHRERWGDRMQILVPDLSIARVWVILAGAQSRWRVHVGAHLGGYWQSAGRKGAALGGVLTRIV